MLIAAILTDLNPITLFVANIEQLAATALAIIAGVTSAAATVAINSVVGFLSADDAQAPSADFQRILILQITIRADTDVAVEIAVSPVRITAEAFPDHYEVGPIANSRVGLPEIRNIFQHRNLALNQITVELGILGSPVNPSGGVVHPALHQQPAARAVSENLAGGLPVVQRLRIHRVIYRENDETDLIPGISGTAVVVAVLGRVERVAAREGRAPAVALRVAHRDEVRRIDADEQLEPNLLGAQLVRKLSVQPLEFAAGGLIRNAQRHAERLEHAA